MPPAALTPELEELASFFQRCGLSEQRATETALVYARATSQRKMHLTVFKVDYKRG
jgi:hypothetical protein